MEAEVSGKDRVLVTTALKETFPKSTSEKILFLGEWCKIYRERDFYNRFDHEVLPYHWDDRKKLYQDFQNIDKIYERVLATLAAELNRIHNESYSVRYWRIIIGPWLRYFIEIFYDRYLSVKQALDAGFCKTYSLEIENSTPFDMRDFTFKFCSDEWNHHIYNEILSYFGAPIEIVGALELKNETYNDSSKSLKRMIADKLFFVNKFNTVHFFSSYLRRIELNSIQLKLKQIPTLGVGLQYVNTEFKQAYNKDMRKSLKLKAETELEKILFSVLCKQVPIVYMEEYKLIRKSALQAYPSRSKLILTANSYGSDDVFKIWAAEMVENGSKYVISQHGGHYGTGLFASHEDHQLKSTDKFFSWGWKWDDRVLPTTAGKLQNKINQDKNKENGHILLILSISPRFSYHLMSRNIAKQELDYIGMQIDFLKALPFEIREKVKIRLHPTDFGWCFRERIEDAGFWENIDLSGDSYGEAISKSKLVIVACNSTTHLETFTSDIPTLLYWDPNHWELRKEAYPYYKSLQQSGVLHYDHKSLCSELSEIYHSPEKWWSSDDVKVAVSKFCKVFANKEGDVVESYCENIKKVINEGTPNVKK